MTQDTLFEPLKVGAVTVGHRLALAPLTRKRAANMVPNDMNITYYRQRGQYPGTLLITEGTLITKNAGYDPYVPGIWTKEQIDGWKKVANAVHEEKSFLFMQLWALGANFLQPPQESIDAGVDYVSASAYSALAKQSGVTPRALTTAEVKQYVKDYAQAAKNAIEGAGLDGVEIHGAHGYLPDQFLHENTNHRTDEYGGSIENRARFLLEIVDAVVEAVGADRVGIRLSPWATFGGVDPGVSPIPQWSYVITELEKRALAGNRLAYLHVVEPRVSGIFNVDAKNKWANDFVYDIWDGVVIKAGQLLDEAREIAAKYPKTLIAIGRYFISNPDLVKRVHDNLGFRKYDRDTFYEHGAEGYISYKNLGEEKI